MSCLVQFAYYSGLASSSPVLAFYLTSALVYEVYITGYGSAFFGLHFYTWTLITSILIIIAVAVILAISSMNVAFRSLNINPDLFSIVGWVFLLLITANLISTVLECGGGECAANPVTYKLLSKQDIAFLKTGLLTRTVLRL